MGGKCGDCVRQFMRIHEYSEHTCRFIRGAFLDIHHCTRLELVLNFPKVLRDVLSDPEVLKSLGPEAHETAQIFWRDFEKSGVNLPPEQRSRFVSLSSEILAKGREFLVEASAARPPATIKPSELQGLKDTGMGARLRLQAKFTQRDLLVYPGSLQAQMIMHSAPQEEPRRKVYMASNSSTPKQIDTLERLLRARGELARLVGKPSYAHMTLADKMAKSPGMQGP